MNTLTFCGTNMTDEMKELMEKARTEFTNVNIMLDDCEETHGPGDLKYTAVANGIKVHADTTHYLFERIKNIIGEAEVAVDDKANERGKIE